MQFLSQFGSEGDIISQIFFFLLFFVFIFIYPRMMITQTLWKLEKDVTELEAMANEGREIVARSFEKKPGAKLKTSIRGFMEFFAVSPVDMDPYGVVRKLDMVVKQSDERFKWFVAQAGHGLGEVQKANIRNALAGAMMSHQIAKIVRHYLEMIKKYKILQLALIIQMQMPLIMRVAKAASAATKAFVEGIPIGDSVGPLVAASMIPARAEVQLYRDEEFAVAPAKISGRQVLIAKASGPGGGTGYPGKFLLKLAQKQKIDRIITVDAALRLEGEKPGSLAEGVGVAIGGSGVDRYEIEEFAVKNKIPLDAVAIKVSDEEALGPMKTEVLEGAPAAIEAVRQALRRAGKNERVLIIGVGNTVGVGNDTAAAKQAEQLIKKVAKQSAKGKGKKKTV